VKRRRRSISTAAISHIEEIAEEPVLENSAR
jgi:hypothetical protein